MIRKARLAIRKVNVALDSPGYCFGTGSSLIPSSRLFVSGKISSKRERACREPLSIRPVKSMWYEYMPRRDSDSWARAYLPF